MRTTRAFTLVEILVVISIIALLIAILLPVLARARRAGADVQCLSHTAQLVKAQISYAQDNDNYFAKHARWDAFTVFSRSFGRGPNWGGETNNVSDGWTGTGFLYEQDYITTMIAWCPVNTSPVFEANNAEQGFRGNPWAQGKRWMGQSYHQNITLQDLEASDSNEDAAFYADTFTDSSHYSPATGEGLDQHHLDGYYVGYMDASASFYNDSDRAIADQTVLGGKGGNGWHLQQIAIWDNYFNKNGQHHSP